MEISVVTGAGSGIGAGVAMKLAARGSFIALADRNDDGVRATLEQIERAGGQGIAATVDVTDENQLAGFIQSVAKDFGRPSTAVACAGIAATGTVVDTSAELFRKMIDVNLTGVFLFAKAIIPFLENGGGTFTAIASDAGLNGFQGYAAYCASKHAVAGLVKSMALDHGPKGVRCNAICPGYVETPMLDQLLAEIGWAFDDAEKAVPLARFAKVDDVANLVDFVSSTLGGYINGALIPIDGGGSAGPFAPA